MMKTLQVPEMHCEKCVARIQNALSAAGIAADISLEDRSVAVEESREETVRELLDDLGFTVS